MCTEHKASKSQRDERKKLEAVCNQQLLADTVGLPAYIQYTVCAQYTGHRYRDTLIRVRCESWCLGPDLGAPCIPRNGSNYLKRLHSRGACSATQRLPSRYNFLFGIWFKYLRDMKELLLFCPLSLSLTHSVFLYSAYYSKRNKFRQ